MKLSFPEAPFTVRRQYSKVWWVSRGWVVKLLYDNNCVPVERIIAVNAATDALVGRIFEDKRECEFLAAYALDGQLGVFALLDADMTLQLVAGRVFDRSVESLNTAEKRKRIEEAGGQ